MRSLSGRLFASTLAALALTLALTIGIGAVLTRRQVDRSHAATLSSLADYLASRTARVGELQDREHGLGIGPRDRRAALAARAVRRRRESLERRNRDLPRRERCLLLPDAALARALAADPVRLRGCLAPVPARPAARGCGRGCARGAPLTRAGPLDRAPHSPRRRGHARHRGSRDPHTAARDRRRRGCRARARVQRDGRAATSLARRRACVPALGQPRAEDAADRDPRLGRRPGGRRVRACRRRAHDQPRVRPARAARLRPARPGEDEAQRVLGPQRAGRPARCRPRGGRPPRGGGAGARRSSCARRARRAGSTPTTTVCCRSPRT